MPMYEYRCPMGHKFTRIRKVAEMKQTETCDCGLPGSKLLSAPMVKGDYPGYSCPVTGKWIEGRRAHEENLAKHGCRVLESGETEEFKRRREEDERALDAKVEATAEEFVEKLDSRKREQLGREIQSGLDVTVVRQ